MLKFAFNLLDDGLVGQQLFAGEATRLAYMTDEAVEGRDAFLEKRAPDWTPVPALLLSGAAAFGSERHASVAVGGERHAGVTVGAQGRPPRLPTVSKSPLRRLTDQIVLATMRPPISPQVLVNRPAIKPVDLRGKRILLTGASSGIGEAAAEQFAREGATVVVVARRQDLLDALAERITTAGGTAMSMPCDISDMDAVDALVAEVEDRVGGVDILINNAGRSIRRPLAESLERWHDVERTMTLNYYAPLRLIRGFAPGMLERGDGHIINVSTWGVLSEASPLFSVYNASKAALSMVSRVVETEWGTKGVHSTTLYYPLVATPMIAPTKAYEGMPALTLRRGRRVDDHRRAHPAGPDRAADGDRGQGAGHLRPATSSTRSCSGSGSSRTAITVRLDARRACGVRRYAAGCADRTLGT